MKKMISKLMVFVLVIGAMSDLAVTTSFASDGEKSESFVSSTLKVTTKVGTALVSGFESAVGFEVNNRSGSKTPTGGKGIVFESLYKGKRNAKNFWNGTVTKFTKSSTAEVVDLYDINSTGVVTARYQLKDCVSDSGAYKVAKQIQSGKYNSAQIVGTTESAKKINKVLSDIGYNSKRVIDSGISSKTTEELAKRINGDISAVVKNVFIKVPGTGAIIEGGGTLAACLVEGADISETIGDTLSSSAHGATIGETGALTAYATKVVIKGMKAPVLVKVVVVFGVSYLVMSIIDEYTEGFFSNMSKSIQEFVDERIQDAKEYIITVRGNLSEGVDTISIEIDEFYELVSDKMIEITKQ